jgi:D-arabinose 1-dehydrogenase-like Zn-dependent alcohol dehydrogenase
LPGGVVQKAVGDVPYCGADVRENSWRADNMITFAQTGPPRRGGFQDLVDVVELARMGEIRTVVEHFPLEKAMDAYQLMREGKLRGRAVILPNG